MLEFELKLIVACNILDKLADPLRDKYLSNNTGTTHYASLLGSFWSDQKNSHNEVIITSYWGNKVVP